MAKLYFRYGAMSAGKTASILQIAKNYEDCNKTALIVKPDIDTRSGDPHIIKSRIGIFGRCITATELPNYLYDICVRFKEYVCNIDSRYENVKIEIADLISCILVDEAQFLTEKQVDYLARLVDYHNIPVICYGLRTDFTGKMFEGSKRLMEIADVIEEQKTICKCCGKAARFNARIDKEGNILRTGSQIMIGDEEYVSLCRKHFFGSSNV